MSEASEEISMNEVRKHNNESSAWIVVDKHVYDVTKYMDEHPGGAEVLLEAAGTNATREFNDVGHSEDAKEIMQKFKMGKVAHDDDKDRCKSCVCFCDDVPEDEDEEESNTSSYTKIALGVLAAALIAAYIAKKKLS